MSGLSSCTNAVQEMQAEAEKALATAEGDCRPLDRSDAYRRMLELVTIVAPAVKMKAFAQMFSQLFPVAPVAMNALCDLLGGDLDDLASWLDLHLADEPALAGQSKRLHDDAAALRALVPPQGAIHRAP